MTKAVTANASPKATHTAAAPKAAKPKAAVKQPAATQRKAPEMLSEIIDRLPHGEGTQEIVHVSMVNASNGFAVTVYRHGETGVKASIASTPSAALRAGVLAYFDRPAPKMAPEPKAKPVAVQPKGSVSANTYVWAYVNRNKPNQMIEFAKIIKYLQPIKNTKTGEVIDEAYDVEIQHSGEVKPMALSHLITEVDESVGEDMVGHTVMATWDDGSRVKAELVGLVEGGYLVKWLDSGNEEVVRLVEPIKARKGKPKAEEAPAAKATKTAKAPAKAAKPKAVRATKEAAPAEDGDLDDADLLLEIEAAPVKVAPKGKAAKVIPMPAPKATRVAAAPKPKAARKVA